MGTNVLTDVMTCMCDYIVVTAGLANTGFIECQTGCCDIHTCQQILRNRTAGVLLELSMYFQSGYQGKTRPGIRPTD